MELTRSSILSVSMLGLLTLLSTSARADLTNFDAFGNMEYTQTANNTAPSGTPSDFFGSRLFYNTPGDITSATGNSGAVTGLTYVPQAGSNFAIAQTGYITPAQLDTYLIPGTQLQFNVTGGNLANMSGDSPNYGSPLFTSAVPYVTGNSYNLLQGLNAAQGALVTINGFTAVTGANESDIFIVITNTSTNAVAYSTSFFDSPSTTSFSVAPGQLDAGTSYNLEVDYSSRLNTMGYFGGVGGVPFTFGYDVRTEIGFTTAAAAVPEPASIVLIAISTVGSIVSRRLFVRAAI